jgi:phage tail-like protein
MPRSSSHDPIRDFKFDVTISPPASLKQAMGITGDLNLGFAVVSGLTVTNDVVSYREGGMNTHPHKLLGQSDYGAITFSRGVFLGPNQDALYKWQQYLHTWSTGALNALSGTSNSGSNDYRCNVYVRVLDHPASGATYVVDPVEATQQTVNLPSMRLGFALYNCWPGAFAMTDLNASSSGILVQQMTLHHEGFVIVNNESDFDKLSQLN